MSVQFQDFSIQVKEALDEKAIAFLHEAGAELEAQAKRNSRVKSGKTKGSYQYKVNESAKETKVGSPEQNAIWEEFGTGEYAAHGDGRKGGWFYVDEDGNGHFTHGKHPRHILQRAYDSRKNAIINLAKQIFGELK